MRALLTAFVLCSLILAVSAPASAQRSTDRDAPPPSLTAAGGDTTSPFTPPEATDEVFVVNAGSGLDTGCSYRSDGPLLIELEMTRHVGEVDANGYLRSNVANRLLQNGLIPPFLTITLPAYDVDVNGGDAEVSPERDEVSFNGTFLGTLTGDNEIWIKNSFTIPITEVKFPALGGPPAVNLFRIDIDTANTVEAWCTAVDWVALEGLAAWRPVLLVHGILSGAETWSQNSGSANWLANLDQRQIGVETVDFGGLALGRIQANSAKIAPAVASMRTRYGVDQIVIAAHSKGGLDSRHYISRNDDVERIVMIGTPNAGSRIASIVQSISTRLIGFPATVLINLFATPAGYQLTPAYMAFYNAFDVPNGGTGYFTIAGNYSEGGLFSGNPLLFGPDDFVVPVSSVYALSYASKEQVATDTYESLHTGQTKSIKVFNRAYTRLYSNLGQLQDSPPPVRSLAGTSLHTAATPLPRTYRTRARPTSAEARPNAADAEQAVTQAGVIQNGATVTHTFTVDASDAATFQLIWGVGEVDLELVAPDGRRIDPAVADGDPTLEFTRLSELEGVRFVTYGVSNPLPGDWMLEVTGTAVTSTGGEGYGVAVELEGSQVTFEAQTDLDAYRSDDGITITAALHTNGVPSTTATVAALVTLPDLSQVTRTFRDNGTAGDEQAGDGIYTARFLDTAQPGYYRILVEGTEGDVARERLLLVSVSASRSAFDGFFNDRGLDPDEDGLFDDLRVTVGATIEADGTYRLSGALRDMNGTIIDETASTERTLTAGTARFALDFDGEAIFRNGVDGPYVLDRAVLTEVGDDEVIVDLDVDVHTTRFYPADAFQRSRIFLTGAFEEEATDLDANDLFDVLDVTLGVNVVEAGSYQWSARLLGSDGTEIDLAAGGGSLQEGDNQIGLTFEGVPIGESLQDGPYVVRDLLVFNASASLVAGVVGETRAYSFYQFEGAPPVETEEAPSGEAVLALGMPSPNPFDRTASVALRLPVPAQVRASAFDVLGREVAVLYDGPLAAGVHPLQLDGGDLTPGTYTLHVAVAPEGRAAEVLTRRFTRVR